MLTTKESPRNWKKGNNYADIQETLQNNHWEQLNYNIAKFKYEQYWNQ